MNAYRKRAYERTVKRVKEQFNENYAAANASFQTEQAKFAEQMMAFAYQKEGLMQQLQQAEGYAAATETWEKRRKSQSINLGDYGRNATSTLKVFLVHNVGMDEILVVLVVNLLKQTKLLLLSLTTPMPEMAAKQYEAPGGSLTLL